MNSKGVRPFEGLASSGEAGGGDEVIQMLNRLAVRLVVIALDGRVLDRPVHPLDLSVSRRAAAGYAFGKRRPPPLLPRSVDLGFLGPKLMD